MNDRHVDGAGPGGEQSEHDDTPSSSEATRAAQPARTASGRPAGASQAGGPLEPPTVAFPSTPKAIASRALQIVASLGLAVVLLGWGLPYLTDTSWATILGLITGIGWPTFLGLFALMMLGLYCYTFTLTGSLPGLGHFQAILANLAGSGVSNTLPGGGAVGAALTYAMFRSWQFTHRAIGTSIIVTAVWNLLARVLLPVIAALVLLPAAGQVPNAMVQGAIVGGIGGAAVAGALIAIIASRRTARLVGRFVERVLGPLLRRLRGGRLPDAQLLALDLRAKIIGVVRTRWLSLTLGLVGFMGVYFVLFRQCLEAVGVDISWSHAFAAYAVGRLLTAVAVTPGGIGVAEAGAAAVLLALGVPGDATAAAVTLFALFSFLLEIPLGALAAVTWLNTRGYYARAQPPAP